MKIIKYPDNSSYYELITNNVNQECSWEQEEDSELKTIYCDGKFFNQTNLTEIRERIANKS